MNRQPITIADVPPADPRVSSEYFNSKFKEWLRRRGLTDPAYAQEYEQSQQRRTFSFTKRKKTK